MKCTEPFRNVAIFTKNTYSVIVVVKYDFFFFLIKVKKPKDVILYNVDFLFLNFSSRL